MRLTTETALGQIIFNKFSDAETFVAEMTEMADEAETFEIRVYQGDRFHVARYYRGAFDGYC